MPYVILQMLKERDGRRDGVAQRRMKTLVSDSNSLVENDDIDSVQENGNSMSGANSSKQSVCIYICYKSCLL